VGGLGSVGVKIGVFNRSKEELKNCNFLSEGFAGRKEARVKIFARAKIKAWGMLRFGVGKKDWREQQRNTANNGRRRGTHTGKERDFTHLESLKGAGGEKGRCEGSKQSMG